MPSCTVCKRLKVVTGCYDDYKQLAHYHYRDFRCGPCAAVFTLKAEPALAGTQYKKPVGVIVYSNPTGELRMRNVATNNCYAGLDRSTRLSLINRDIRRISRVIIEPRFRGLGLAARLVAETMPLMEVPIIEAVAVMGLVNPFFEKAGMRPYIQRPPASSVRLIEAFSVVGIEEVELIDAKKVQRKLDRLSEAQAGFVEREIRIFLKPDSRNRYSRPGLEQTRYVLSKVTTSGVYYIWFNERTEKVYLSF